MAPATVAVVVPWRDTGDEYRRRNLAALQEWLAPMPWPIILADSNGPEFNRSQARNNGVKQADADVIVLHDADMRVDITNLRDTARQVAKLGGLRHPYRAVRYLDENNTQLILNRRTPRSVLRVSRNAPGGCAVILREEYLALGGYDESYQGWGYEDLDFAARAKASIGHYWGQTYAYHLWHPEAARDAKTSDNRDRYQTLTKPEQKLMPRAGIDVVYRVRPGDNNEELRYSLRSLVNLAHRDVWLVGHKPSWIADTVRHIPANRHNSKWPNVYDNLRIACREPDISDPFILLDDDMFLMHELAEVPQLHRGSLAAQAATKRQSLWDDSIRSTLAYLESRGYEDPTSYELHIPYLVHKAEMLQALDAAADWSWPNPPQWRTLDGNVWHRGGTKAPDVKIGKGEIPDDPWMLSSTDATFAHLRPTLAARFPEACRYER